MGAAAYHRGSKAIIDECRAMIPFMSAETAKELHLHIVAEAKKKRLELIENSDKGWRIVHVSEGCWWYGKLDKCSYPNDPEKGSFSMGWGYSGFKSHREIFDSPQFMHPEIVATDRETSFCGDLKNVVAVYYCRSMSNYECLDYDRWVESNAH